MFRLCHSAPRAGTGAPPARRGADTVGARGSGGAVSPRGRDGRSALPALAPARLVGDRRRGRASVGADAALRDALARPAAGDWLGPAGIAHPARARRARAAAAGREATELRT